MSVWVTVPSARPVAEVEKWAAAWRERGYKIALWRDTANCEAFTFVDAGKAGEYPGYARAVNSLVTLVRILDPQAEWFVIGGDDVYPDPNRTAEETARECSLHFAEQHIGSDRVGLDRAVEVWRAATFGVMQPTGDRWGENLDHPNPAMRSAYVDRVCGSAWIGREFAKRVNQGRGPLWPEYQHMFVDAELQAVATRLGVLWQRPDLTHHHAHAARKPGYNGHVDCPPHLRRWSVGEEGRKHWVDSEDIYKRREKDNFPGHQPL